MKNKCIYIYISGIDQMMETTVADGENNSNKYINGGSTSHPSSSKSRRIFTLRAVNSFGRDELGTVLVDDGKPLRILGES